MAQGIPVIVFVMSLQNVVNKKNQTTYYDTYAHTTSNANLNEQAQSIHLRGLPDQECYSHPN